VGMDGSFSALGLTLAFIMFLGFYYLFNLSLVVKAYKVQIFLGLVFFLFSFG
jgi:hypothetical protein